MKKTLRQGLMAATAIFALTTLPLIAGPRGGGGPDGERGGHGIGRLLPPPGYLDLTEEQKAAAEKLRDDAKTKIEPLMAGQKAARQQLHSLLESASPDPAAVGTLTIQLHQGRQAVKDVLLATEQSFIALLNDEQKVKYENFRELRRDRRGKMAERFGFGEGEEE